jgi:hypothetical protein
MGLWEVALARPLHSISINFVSEYLAMLFQKTSIKALLLSITCAWQFSLLTDIDLLADSWGQAPQSETPAADASQTPPATASLPLYPLDVCVNAAGDAFVVDRNLPGVWQWQADKLSIFFQGSTKYRTPLNAPRCLAIDPQGKLLVGDSATREIYRFSDDGKPEPITGGKIGVPMDMAFKSDGTLYVADLELRMLLRIPAGTSDVEQVAAVNPRGVFVDAKDQVWVVSQDAAQLLIVSDDGKTEAIVKQRVFEFPHQVVVNAAGEAFVSDGYKPAIWKVVPGNPPEAIVTGAPLVNPVGLALVDDRVVIVDPRSRIVSRLGADNRLETWFTIDR